MARIDETVFDNLIFIGIVSKPHGTNGEVKVKSLTDFPARFQDLKRVSMVSKAGNLFENVIQNVKIRKKDSIFIKFNGINSISEASELVGAEIAINKEDCVKLPPDFYYLFDLVGMQVVLSHNGVVGTIEDIESSMAQDILLVKTISGKNVMVPFVKEIVPEVLMNEKKVIVNNISGLFDEE